MGPAGCVWEIDGVRVDSTGGGFNSFTKVVPLGPHVVTCTETSGKVHTERVNINSEGAWISFKSVAPK